MNVIQSRSSERKVKRFRKPEKKILDKHIRKILANPTVGQEKKGDMRGVYVHKFKVHAVENLLSYRFVGETLELIMIGPHGNYYRDLKTYLKNR